MTEREIANKFFDDTIRINSYYLAIKGKIDFPNLEGLRSDISKSSGDSKDNDSGRETESDDK